MKYLALAALLLSLPAFAFPHGGGPSPSAIGGIAVGARGPTGTEYPGFTPKDAKHDRELERAKEIVARWKID